MIMYNSYVSGFGVGVRVMAILSGIMQVPLLMYSLMTKSYYICSLEVIILFGIGLIARNLIKYQEKRASLI